LAKVSPRRALLVIALLTVPGAGALGADATVTVVRPTQARITRYLEATGTVTAMQSVDLVARIAGTLDSIEVPDGAQVRQGTILFVIEPLPYESKLRQAQAAQDQQRALSTQAEAEYQRQVQLRSSSASSQATLENALASRDSTQAALKQAEQATQQAAITYAYTRVTAPFDGVMTAHLVSVGELVGASGPTKLATLMQLDPIWVNASISEADVREVRTYLAARGKTVRDLDAVPVEAALQGESGFPHHGTLDYVAPQVDAGTGTLAIRARFDNPGFPLLPGYFMRLRVPLVRDADVLLLPPDAILSDQGTPTVFVVGGDGAVRQVPVHLGGVQDGMQIVDGGIKPDDRVIASADTPIEPGARLRVVEGTTGPAKP
jgi:RND family efflux transporter MFP subunit